MKCRIKFGVKHLAAVQADGENCVIGPTRSFVSLVGCNKRTVHITPVKSVHDRGIYIDADPSMRIACPENGVVLLCRSSSTSSDPPICTYLHIPEAGSCPGAFPAGLRQGLRQRRVGGYSCPPNAPTPVGSECSGTADLQSETLRPHHRRTRQPSLAAGPGAPYSIRLQY